MSTERPPLMKRAVRTAKHEATERASLRRRVKQFYARFNNADSDGCYALIDSQLTQQDKVKVVHPAP